MKSVQTHLSRLEAEAIEIMREVVSEAENPVMLYSVGKDSAVMLHLAQAFASSGKSQLSVVEVDRPDISKYGVVVPNGTGAFIAGLVEKPEAHDTHSNLASIGRYVLTPDIFETLRGLTAGSGEEIHLADAINIHAQRGSADTFQLEGRRFDCGAVNGFVQASALSY